LGSDLWISEHVPEPDPPPIVVLVHGSLDRSAAFSRVGGHLRDLHTVRYDRRGYGRSVRLGAPPLSDHADDLLAIIDGRPAVVIGHSIGGVITLMAAERDPEVIRAVGSYEAPMPWQPWWPKRSAGGAATAARDPGDAAEAFMRRMVGDARWEALPEGTRRDRRAEGPALLAELASARSGRAYDIDAITVPVLLARGSEGAEHHREGTARLAASLGREPFVIEGAGHGGHVSHHAEFARFVREVVAAAG
jgi:pimeloyl-ACP methyl ester carboxylesterase